MRRILFYSMLALGAGARAESRNAYDFLTSLKGSLGDRSPEERRKLLGDEITDIKKELEEIRSKTNDPHAAKEVEARIKELELEQKILRTVKSSVVSPRIEESKWIGPDKDGQFEARITGTPFTIIQKEDPKGKVKVTVNYSPKGREELGEVKDKDMRSSGMKDYAEDDVKKIIDKVNDELGKDPTSLAKGETFGKDSTSFKAITKYAGILSRNGGVAKWLEHRDEAIGGRNNAGSELQLAYDDKDFLSKTRSRSDRVAELNQMLSLAADLRNGKTKVGESDEEICKQLIKTAGSFQKLSAAVQNECRLYEEKAAVAKKKKEEGEEKEVTAAKEQQQKQKEAFDPRLEAQIRQNMALCEAIAQRATRPMPAPQQKTLAEIVEKITTNPRLLCPTFSLLMSDAAAESYDTQMGGGNGDMLAAVNRELSQMDGMDPSGQMEFVGDKARRIVQEYFVAPVVKTTARGNMREGQSALNAKMENDRNEKLMKEKSCLEKMAASMGTLAANIQHRSEMGPLSPDEEMAMVRVGQYNSIAQMLLTSVNREISVSNLSGSGVDLSEPAIRRIPLGRGNEASSVRVNNQRRRPGNNAPIMDSQGVSPRNNRGRSTNNQMFQ
jgi:hypothetical protein